MKCIVLLSGGMDSSTLLAMAVGRFDQVQALSLIYGQRHEIEINCAAKIAKHFQVPHTIADLSDINPLIQGSSLTTSEIETPQGHYEDESMKITVVPGRNTILLSLALGYCISQEFDTVAYAAHAGDHAIYPDCRPEFVKAIQKVFELAHYCPIDLWVPFLDIDKGDILDIGMKLRVPYEKTWTCYDPQTISDPDSFVVDKACGKCGACQERLEGFAKIGVKDPIQYVGE